ncbi:hypothetical protein BN891_4190 [Bacteroides xylanisolvens SD CC 2a]|nr:hypothetical protein BN891_4190 [Bacteroides xylanisolvens SD CC 2a]
MLSDCLFPPGSAVPPVRRVPFPYVSRRSCRCHRRVRRRWKRKARGGGEHPQHDAAACFRRQAVQIPFETCRQAFPFVVEFPIHAPH